jgi:TatA/E family protein of Tat protein translocase
MFGPLGVPEVLFILVLALLVFGPRKLPELGRTLGRAMGEFRKASTELKRSFNAEIALEEEKERQRAPSPRPAAIAPAAPGASEPRIPAKRAIEPGPDGEPAVAAEPAAGPPSQADPAAAPPEPEPVSEPPAAAGRKIEPQ